MIMAQGECSLKTLTHVVESDFLIRWVRR